MKVDLELVSKIGRMLGPVGGMVSLVADAIHQAQSRPDFDPTVPLEVQADAILRTIDHGLSVSQETRDIIAAERARLHP